MKTIACVYWQGVFRGRENVYTPEWVLALKNNIELFYRPDSYRFVCLTNVPEQLPFCETIELTDNLPGWWSKLELFKPNQFEGRVLYLDLDTFILQSPDSLFNETGTFTICGADGFGSGYDKEGLYVIKKYQSSVMVWDANTTNDIYTEFDYELRVNEQHLRGDQEWLALARPNASLFPEDWVDKYRNWRGKELPKNMKVMLAMAPGCPNKNADIVKENKELGKIWKP